MKIAIDCRSILNPERGEAAGIGHYVDFLVRRLLQIDEDNRYVLFFDDHFTRGRMAEIIGSNRHASARVLPLCRYKKFLPYAYSHHLVAKAITRESCDVFHSPTGSLPMGYGGDSVITVHDLAIYLHPEWFPGGQFFARRFVVPASVRKAKRIIAVSRSTRDDLVRIFGAPPDRISVVHEGVERREPGDIDKVLRRHKLSKPYLLFLGTIEPRKNVVGLVRAFVSLARTFPDLVGGVELVIAGGQGWKSDEAFIEMERANRALGRKSATVKYLGYVPDKDKYPLMAGAEAFVFPTFYEGFGLPVLEAMSLGVPVISSDVSSLPEVVGEAGILVDPGDSAELTLALKQVLENPRRREELGRLASARSVEFSWDKAAGETLEVYERVAREKTAAPGAAHSDLSGLPPSVLLNR